MTRINCGIPPKTLHRKHLLAEHYELVRIPNQLHKADLSIPIPKKFRLGEGHVRFFYDKGLYLLKRYLEIRKECIRRKYNVQNFASSFDVYKKKKYAHLFNDYKPTPRDRRIVQNRINNRLKKMD